jgi:dolichol-phosphate mannosyltransferase
MPSIEYQRIKRFLIAGASAAVVNLAFMGLFVEICGFKGYWLKNIANISSMEISIFYNFILCRSWTWSDTLREQGVSLLRQFFIFNSAALSGMLIRIGLFAFFEMYGMNYLMNVCLGIGSVAILSFFFYDRVVFKRKRVSLVKRA